MQVTAGVKHATSEQRRGSPRTDNQFPSGREGEGAFVSEGRDVSLVRLDELASGRHSGSKVYAEQWGECGEWERRRDVHFML